MPAHDEAQQVVMTERGNVPKRLEEHLGPISRLREELEGLVDTEMDRESGVLCEPSTMSSRRPYTRPSRSQTKRCSNHFCSGTKSSAVPPIKPDSSTQVLALNQVAAISRPTPYPTAPLPGPRRSRSGRPPGAQRRCASSSCRRPATWCHFTGVMCPLPFAAATGCFAPAWTTRSTPTTMSL